MPLEPNVVTLGLLAIAVLAAALAGSRAGRRIARWRRERGAAGGSLAGKPPAHPAAATPAAWPGRTPAFPEPQDQARPPAFPPLAPPVPGAGPPSVATRPDASWEPLSQRRRLFGAPPPVLSRPSSGRPAPASGRTPDALSGGNRLAGPSIADGGARSDAASARRVRLARDAAAVVVVVAVGLVALSSTLVPPPNGGVLDATSGPTATAEPTAAPTVAPTPEPTPTPTLRPPSVEFTWSATALKVKFTNRTHGAESWTWHFGDGATSTGRNPSHEYAAPGTYTVTLVAVASNGASASASHEVTVAEP